MKNKKKTAAAVAVTAAAVAGMVTGTVIDDPADLLTDPDPVVSAQLEDADDAAPEQRQRGPAARLRIWLLSLPAAVRMLVVLPLWGLGWVLLTGLSTFGASAATPLLARLVRWLCLALLLTAVFTAGAKAAFPALPLRRFLRPRNVLFILAATFVLALADAVLPSVWTGYDVIQQTVWRVGATCLLAFLCGAALKRQGRRCAAKAAVPVQPSRRTAVEEEARRLADTVCPRQH